MDDKLELQETISSIVLDVIAELDEFYEDHPYDLQGLVVLVETTHKADGENSNDDAGLFIMRNKSQPLSQTLGMIGLAKMNCEARWHGWEEYIEEDDE